MDHVVQQILLFGRVVAAVLHQIAAHGAHVRGVGFELGNV
jgi:hypothetical protein